MTSTIATLHGDWRRRVDSRTDAHLYRRPGPLQLPECGKRVARRATAKAPKSTRPCYGCLVAAVTARR